VNRSPVGSVRSAALLFASLACVAAARPAGAATYCVDTAAELQSALSAAAASSADDVIDIESGTYATTSPQGFRVVLSAPGDLRISGGWSGGCVFQVAGQRSTIDGELHRPGMVLLGTQDTAGLLHIDHLSFIHGRSSEAHIAGGLTANPYLSHGFGVEIESNRFVDNSADDPAESFGGGLKTDASNGLLLRDNVFKDNHAAHQAGGAMLYCDAGLTAITNNTFTANSAGSGLATDTGGLFLQGTCVTEIVNNILWGNDGLDLSLLTPGVVVRYNDIAHIGGTEAPGSSTANLDVNPQFESAGILRLERTSPLIDIGFDEPLSGLSAQAFEGGPRLVGPHVDFGAYELDKLFDDGFDPPFILTDVID
jgi:hypothetical protein